MIFKSLLNTKCDTLYPETDLETIELFEKKVGKIFPKELKDFYLLTNGCYSNKYIYSYEDIPLLPLGPIVQIQELEDLSNTVREYCDDNGIKVIIHDIENLLPISPTTTQAILFIGCGGDKLNKVYLADTVLIEHIGENLFLFPYTEVSTSLTNFFEQTLKKY